MVLLTPFIILLALCYGVLNMPVGLNRRDIDAYTLGNLSFYGQYATAAYCPNNKIGPATMRDTKKITYPTSNNCPEVQANNGAAIIEFQNLGDGDTTGLIAIDLFAEKIIVSFRGSESLENLITNLDFVFENTSDICHGCQLSTGFSNDWKAANTTVINAVTQAKRAAENKGYDIIVTGHSLGAAVATICAAVLRGKYSYPVTLYTYGSPMVDKDAFANYNDLVPNLPGYSFDYRHVSPQYWITSATDAPVTASDVEVSSGTEDESDDYYSLLRIFETSNSAHN